ncbi:MAG: phosphopantetheine-binding protein [Gammaproteobacteria bacterium]
MRPLDASLTETQRETSRFFAEALGVESIEPTDNFFQLGGYSLLAMNLVATLSERFGMDLPLPFLFERPTAAQAAAEIDRLLQSEATA